MSGLIFIVAAPSGAGKSSLVSALLSVDPNVKLSVSYTTRPPRPGEQDGREYHFTDQATFKAMAAKGDFLESAEVHGNFYGTSQTWLDRTRAEGQDIVLEIDWQGAQQVRRLYSAAAVGIFILPPSMAELERRLRTRGQDSDAVIQKRLANAAEELGHVAEFDYAIINNDFDEASRDLAAIVRAARLRTANQIARSPAAFRII